MTRLLLPSLTCLCTLLVFGCSGNQQAFTLRYHSVPGRSLTYQHTTTRNFLVTAKDSVIDSGSGEYHMTIIMECNRIIDDSIAQITEQHLWDEIKKNAQDTTKIDTVHQNETLTMQMTSNGRVSNLQFLGDVNVTQSAYTQNVAEQGTPVFPDNELSQGSNWTQTSQITIDGKQQDASTTYQVTGFMREGMYECAVIQYGGNMVIPVVENPADTSKRSGVDHITTDGTLYFAPKEGVFVKQHEHWTVTGERRKLVKGEFTGYNVTVNMDVDVQLVNPDSTQTSSSNK